MWKAVRAPEKIVEASCAEHPHSHSQLRYGWGQAERCLWVAATRANPGAAVSAVGGEASSRLQRSPVPARIRHASPAAAARGKPLGPLVALSGEKPSCSSRPLRQAAVAARGRRWRSPVVGLVVPEPMWPPSRFHSGRETGTCSPTHGQVIDRQARDDPRRSVDGGEVVRVHPSSTRGPLDSWKRTSRNHPRPGSASRAVKTQLERSPPPERCERFVVRVHRLRAGHHGDAAVRP